MHFPLLVQGRDWFGSDTLAATRVQGFERRVLIDRPYGVQDHVAAVVGLGHDAIGLPRHVLAHRDPRPAFRRVLTAAIRQHIAVVVFTDTGDDDARLI